MNGFYAAHKSDTGKIQTIKEHLINVAKIAEEFGSKFSSEKNAYICGILHDIGKYSERFQKRLFEGGHFVDHSTAGAIEIRKLAGLTGTLLAYCIAGHHGGIPDGGSPADTSDEPTLNGRFKKKVENYEDYLKDLILDSSLLETRINIKPLEKFGFSIAFYTRMLFSCLVDADFLDTERFMSGSVDRETGEKIEVLCEKLDEYLKGFSNRRNEIINKKRDEILRLCMSKSVQDKGVYTLTVPTGGGKTVSSLAFALKHANLHKMDRVIYVIPYNSIIEQNAKKFKEILGEENVLEHHSNFSFDDNEELSEKYRLAAENWDMPVVVTTTVQFFESLFSNKPSKCRKLHNIANSVIIFDEAQMLPTQYLLPSIRAISELVVNYNCTTVLCSATQPALGKLFPREIQIKEISENVDELFKFFKRTNIIHIGQLDNITLSERLNEEKQVLCIVNSRKQAQKVYELLKSDGKFHLSTLMYPLHRKMVLDEIRKCLAEGKTCRVISTSLIEAGVDVDFPSVYRSEAGLDSEIQAAGRCNREGKRNICSVYVFRPEEEYRKHIPAMLKRPIEVTHSIQQQFEDVSTQEAIREYFLQLYNLEGQGLDVKGIVKSFEDGFEKGLSFPFAEVSEIFKLIENNTIPIIIPDTDEAVDLVTRLRNGERSRKLMRRIQQYTVNVYQCNYEALLGTGSIELQDQSMAILTDMSKYNRWTGLDSSTDMGQGIFI